jgi:hypothetical protein
MKFESEQSSDQLPKVRTDLFIPSGKKNSAIHLIYLPPNQNESFGPMISETKGSRNSPFASPKANLFHDLPFVCQDSHPCCDFD